MRLRVATFNVHHCEGLDGVVDLARTASVLRSVSPDLVGMQELDRGLTRSGHADQPGDLERLLGLEVEFFPTLTRTSGEYGIGLASSSSVAEARFVPLPQLGREEPRGVLTGRCSGLQVVVTHLSTDRRARRLQLAALTAIAAGFEGPTVVMGDLNLGARSLTPLIRLGFSGAFGHSTLPGRLAKRQIDHILVSPGVDILRSWTVPTDASDHLPLVADLVIPD